MDQTQVSSGLQVSSRLPVRLDHARAWRTYLGGKMLDEFHGCAVGTDGHFPEEWIVSLVAARNPGRESVKEEGMSHVQGTDITLRSVIQSDPSSFLGTDHVKRLGTTMGVLVKLIDSAERLAVQVHPDRDKARELFGSEYGKTECWHILGGRTVNGEKPCVYMGFKEGVTRQQWMGLFDRQDIDGMLQCLHRFEVEPGDTVLIEGGVPHAIGAGCFLTEIQEPTDYTIRVERVTPSGYSVEDAMCHQGLGFERMFDCFHYEGLSRKETKKRWFLKRRKKIDCREGRVDTLVGYEDTPFFSMDCLTIPPQGEGLPLREDGLRIPKNGDCSGLYVLEGKGVIRIGEDVLTLDKGEQFFLPAAMDGFTLSGTGGETLKLIRLFGPG